MAHFGIFQDCFVAFKIFQIVGTLNQKEVIIFCELREQYKTWLIPIITGYAISMSNKDFCQRWVIHIVIDRSCGLSYTSQVL